MKIDEALNQISNLQVRRCIEQYLYFDPLTNLPNEKLLETRLNELIEKSKRNHERFTYCIFDIAGTKYLNDNYGKSTGNQMIINAAKHLTTQKRPYDFLARDGNAADEFVMLVENMSQEHHKELKNRILNQNADYILHNIPLVLYMGFSVYSGQSKEEFKAVAERELNKDKKRVQQLYPWLSRK